MKYYFKEDLLITVLGEIVIPYIKYDRGRDDASDAVILCK